MNKIAIIDLGTNTFNLLIADVSKKIGYKTTFQTKLAVKLGEGGIDKGFITPAAFQRGIDAIKHYKEMIDKFEAEKTIAIATSAIRGASNGEDFIASVKKECDIDIQPISGDKEAEYIYWGVREAVKMNDETSLIIDIGGGSTEFIIASKQEVLWKQSFKLGAARLLEIIKPSNPITDDELATLKTYLRDTLQPLFEAVEKYPITELIGSSGSFDSLAEMIALRFYTLDVLKDKTEYSFNINDIEAIHTSILKSTTEERLKMEGLVEMRVDMIVISSVIVDFIMHSFSIQKMKRSTYSLKEGVIYEYLNPEQ